MTTMPTAQPMQPPGTPTLRCGVILPGGTAPEQLELAALADRSGWDGVFVWECAYGVDAWSLLAAMAVRTQRVRLGTLLTPLPWRRPWKVASQAATLDQLSAGRAVLAVGVGAIDPDLPQTGEATELRARAAMMDEGIDLIRGLWSGATQFHGLHYQYTCAHDDLGQVGRPVQERIPIWVVGAWPRPRSMRRVLRCDGVIPEYHLGGRAGAPDDVRDLRAWLNEHAGPADPPSVSAIDVIAEGETPADDPAAAAAHVGPWAAAGCTWWLETRWELPHHTAERLNQVRERIAAGPPRLL
ncbi:MAG TPA: LLM class flavin-dependent oxidoreductase [Actinocrinis sp.]|jgi:alkanesulfonate monooxygenase SsuD/methylene tetrahydromethanopterin reductase-like flavin-dependent oxidoreductase (luciferase family)